MLIIVWRVSCPFKKCMGKIAVQLKSHGESEIARNYVVGVARQRQLKVAATRVCS